MEVKNSVVPNESQLAGFSEPGPAGPIWMINLLKFRERAEYEDGRETDLSGVEAYGLQGQLNIETIAADGEWLGGS